MSIDIVLPCYNPIEGWADNVLEQFRLFKQEFPIAAIGLIIVNDGSGQLDTSKVDWLKSQLPEMRWMSYEQNKGKGAALREGVAHSTAEHIIFTDIDFPFTFPSLLAVAKALLSGAHDIVVGHRPENYYDKTPGERKMISKLLRWTNRNIFKLAVSDTQCGLKGFNQKGKTFFLMTTINRYLFDLEFLMLASQKKHKLNIHPCEVELRDEVVFSKLNSRIYFTEGKNILLLYFRKLFS